MTNRISSDRLQTPSFAIERPRYVSIVLAEKDKCCPMTALEQYPVIRPAPIGAGKSATHQFIRK
jgi:hypothetical protein